MKSTRLRISIILLSMLVYLVVSLGGTDALVLCFGSDSHIKVETAPCGLNCAHSSKTTPKSVVCKHSMMDDAISNCSSCVDIPILNDILIQSISTAQNGVFSIKLILLTPFPLFPHALARFVVCGLFIKPLADNNSTLDFIHSVILLI